MEFIMMIGPPASGKSTLADEYRKAGWKVHSTDLLRKELFGSEEILGKPAEIYGEVARRVKKDLTAGYNCVMDATNQSRKKRIELLRNLKQTGCTAKCLILLLEPETCIKRNAERRRHVPGFVIDRMLRSFEVPYYYEGWDSIEAVYTGDGWKFPFEKTIAFSQDNPHHTLTLGGHLSAAASYAKEKNFSENVQEAAAYHDIGKFYTKKFENHKGLPTEFAHFYGHENASAYLYLCEKAPEALEKGTWDKTLYIANIINWHMRPLVSWSHSKKSENRDRELMGEEMFADIMRLHEADVLSH